jgi:Uncharacterized conserved protein
MTAPSGLSATGKIFFSSLCASTFGLGCWQAQRYFEKIEQVKQREEELSQDPVELGKNVVCTREEMSYGNINTNSSSQQQQQKQYPPDEQKGNSNEHKGYRPVYVQGRFRHQDEILIGPRGPPLGALSASGPNSGRSSGGMASSPQGYYCLTPFERRNGMGTIIVNRGWIPRSHVQENTAWSRPNDEMVLVGIVSKTEQPRLFSPVHSAKDPKQLLWFDRNAIEEKTKTAGSHPVLLTEVRNTSDQSKEVANGPPFKPSKESVGEFKVTPATHAGYAVTWFGLSGAGILMTRKLMMRGRGG